MLTITITAPKVEFYDEAKEEFVTMEDLGEVTLELEHSLVSLSKWESKIKKPFLDAETRTTEEMLFYVECMCLTPNFPRGIFSRMSQETVDIVAAYIAEEQTATWFNNVEPEAKNGQKLTNELIYYWMFSAGIDKECENWHLSRLLTLIKVFGVKNADPKKESRGDMLRRHRNQNAEMRAKHKSKG